MKGIVLKHIECILKKFRHMVLPYSIAACMSWQNTKQEYIHSLQILPSFRQEQLFLSSMIHNITVNQKILTRCELQILNKQRYHIKIQTITFSPFLIFPRSFALSRLSSALEHLPEYRLRKGWYWEREGNMTTKTKNNKYWRW